MCKFSRRVASPLARLQSVFGDLVSAVEQYQNLFASERRELLVLAAVSGIPVDREVKFADMSVQEAEITGLVGVRAPKQRRDDLWERYLVMEIAPVTALPSLSERSYVEGIFLV